MFLALTESNGEPNGKSCYTWESVEDKSTEAFEAAINRLEVFQKKYEIYRNWDAVSFLKIKEKIEEIKMLKNDSVKAKELGEKVLNP